MASNTQNGTKSSKLVTYALKGGATDTIMKFTHNPNNDKVLIRHHCYPVTPDKFIDQFHIDVDGKPHVIFANDWHTAALAKSIWDSLIRVEGNGGYNRWVRVEA